MSDEWFYAIAGQQQGPVTTDTLRGLISAGNVAGDSLAWKEGMEQWTAVSLLPELLAAGTSPNSAPYQLGEAMPLPPVALSYGGYEQYPGRRGLEYGGFWIRVGAAFIDGLILWIPNWILQTIMGSVMSSTLGGRTPGTIIFFSLASMGITIILDWLYYAGLESSDKQATFGKQACGLVVTDLEGKRISFGRATGRYFAKQLSSLILCIGYIMVGFDERKRGLHDQLAKTYVVKKFSLANRVA